MPRDWTVLSEVDIGRYIESIRAQRTWQLKRPLYFWYQSMYNFERERCVTAELGFLASRT